MARPVCLGNWKMHLSLAEARSLAKGVAQHAAACPEVLWGVIPPQIAIDAVSQTLLDQSVDTLAQSCHWAAQGPYTGACSAEQVRDAGAKGVLIGHSERRIGNHETLEDTQKMAQAAQRAGLIAVVCLGERLEDKKAHRTESSVAQQLLAVLRPGEIAAEKLMIAYEPVWAIGTGLSAEPAEANGVHKFLRGLLKEHYGAQKADTISLVYGGSVSPQSAPKLAQQDHIDGFLVGGQSLSAEAFFQIGETLRHKAASR